MSSEQQDVDDFKIRPLTAEGADVDVNGAKDVGLTVLPLRRTEDGRGVYAQDQAYLVKELRSEGVDIDFLDDPKSRVFEAKYGFMTDFAIPYLFGLSTNGGWAALVAMVRRLQGKGGNNFIRITAIEARTGKGWALEGPAEFAPGAIEKFAQEVQSSDGE